MIGVPNLYDDVVVIKTDLCFSDIMFNLTAIDQDADKYKQTYRKWTDALVEFIQEVTSKIIQFHKGTIVLWCVCQPILSTVGTFPSVDPYGWEAATRLEYKLDENAKQMRDNELNVRVVHLSSAMMDFADTLFSYNNIPVVDKNMEDCYNWPHLDEALKVMVNGIHLNPMGKTILAYEIIRETCLALDEATRLHWKTNLQVQLAEKAAFQAHKKKPGNY